MLTARVEELEEGEDKGWIPKGPISQMVISVSLCVARQNTTRLEMILTVCCAASHDTEQHKNHCSCKKTCNTFR
jgi:hypothetical protein